MNITYKVKFYLSGDIVRDIGIIYFSEILNCMGINYELNKNYLEFDYVEPSLIADYILNNLIFEVFKVGKREKLKEKLGDLCDLSIENFEKYINDSNISIKEKCDLMKEFNNRRFPYMRNSSKFGLNTTLENMEKNLRELVNIVFKSNIGVKKIDLNKFKEKDIICNVCNINKITELDITLNKKIDSKLTFLFRGTEKSGFRNNGHDEGNICFECEFLNLMCLLYINLEKPNTLAYVNNLRELWFVNYKLMLRRKIYSDKAFYSKLLHEKVSALRIYDFYIDTNKGVILKFNSIVDYKKLIKKIEFMDIIDNYNFTRDAMKLIEIGKNMVNNDSIEAFRELLLDNLINIKSEGASREIDNKSSLYNLMSYMKFLWIINDKGENQMNRFKEENYIYSRAGKELSCKMDDPGKRNFVFRVIQSLKSNDKNNLFQTIMHTLASYEVHIESGFVEGIMQQGELELNTNVGLFVQELMQ